MHHAAPVLCNISMMPQQLIAIDIYIINQISLALTLPEFSSLAALELLQPQSTL